MSSDVFATDEHSFEGKNMVLNLFLHHVQGMHERVEAVACMMIVLLTG